MPELSESDYNKLCDMLAELAPCIDGMNETPAKFVRDQIERQEKFGPSMFMSPKQMAWLQRLHEEHVGTASHSSDLTEMGEPSSDDPRFNGEADDIPF